MAVSALAGAQCVLPGHLRGGPPFLASGHPRPTPTGGCRGGCGVCLHGQGGWEEAERCLWCPAAPCPMRGPAASAPTLGQIPTCPGPRHGGPPAHPGWLHQALPLGIFSKPATFLWGFTHPTHHTLSWVGATASLPHLPGRQHPVSSAFENQTKAQPGPGAQPGIRGQGDQTCLFTVPSPTLSAVLPGAQREPLGLQTQALGRCGLEKGLPGEEG